MDRNGLSSQSISISFDLYCRDRDDSEFDHLDLYSLVMGASLQRGSEVPVAEISHSMRSDTF